MRGNEGRRGEGEKRSERSDMVKQAKKKKTRREKLKEKGKCEDRSM